MMGGTENGSPSQKALRDAGPYLMLGLQLGLTMTVWSLIGYFADRWLDTLPWLTMAGALVGMVGVFIQLSRVASQTARKTSKSGDDATSKEDLRDEAT